MEIREDTFRVKEEPNDTCPDAGDDYNFDSVDSCKAKNIEKLPFHELSYNDVNVTGQQKLDENIFIDCECKNVKLELPSLLTTNCKSEHCLSIVKVENQNQTSFLDGKSPIVLIKKDFDYHSKCYFEANPRLKIDKYSEVRTFGKNIQPKLSYEYEREASLNTLVSSSREKIRLCENEICYESFSYKSSRLRTKSFECEICQKSFDYQSQLKRHVNAVHDRIKPSECEICHKSFGQKTVLNRHINSVHNRIKPFECDICHKSFGRKEHLKTHISAVHNRNRPFECNICHKSFGQKGYLNFHIRFIHDRSKPFK